MEQTFMKEKKILPLVLSMSLPMVISMAVNSLYNIIDRYFVAKVSENAMTALALVYPIQNFINAIAIGFGVGINAIIAFYLGADDQVHANRAATLGIMLSFIHGILLMFICIIGMPLFIENFTSDKEIIHLSLRYSRRVFLFSPIITIADFRGGSSPCHGHFRSSLCHRNRPVHHPRCIFIILCVLPYTD